MEWSVFWTLVLQAGIAFIIFAAPVLIYIYFVSAVASYWFTGKTVRRTKGRMYHQ